MNKLQSVIQGHPELKQLTVTLMLLSLVLTGCTSKKTQCMRLLTVVNQGHTLISDKGKVYDAATTQQLANELSLVANNVEAVKVSNRKLKEIQAGFTQVFRDLSQMLNEMGAAFADGEKSPITSEGRAQLQQAIVQVDEAGQSVSEVSQRANALVDEMTKVCPRQLR
ncbi:MAG: hypothetical protein ACFBSC_18825 [Microcoleaceae cyanobacterium]